LTSILLAAKLSVKLWCFLGNISFISPLILSGALMN